MIKLFLLSLVSIIVLILTLRFFSYDGEWRQGVMHGKGTYQFDDDCKFEGTFEEGLAEGEGSSSYPGGQTYRGGWKHGGFVVPTFPL